MKKIDIITRDDDNSSLDRDFKWVNSRYNVEIYVCSCNSNNLGTKNYIKDLARGFNEELINIDKCSIENKSNVSKQLEGIINYNQVKVFVQLVLSLCK